jgi:hypothetical protein
MADEEFATVQHGALENAIATIVIVLTILWLARRPARLDCRCVSQSVR